MSSDFEHLRPEVDALVAVGNEVVHGGFRPTQRGTECSLKLPLDPLTATALAAADPRLQFSSERDELTCRHCWTIIHGGAAQERYSAAWLHDLGYDVEFSESDGWLWASLRPQANPDFTLPRYGRGQTRGEAAESAAQRWRVEQIGNNNERKPGEPLP